MQPEPNPISVAAKTGIKARVLVIEDHPLVREGLSEFLNRQEDLLCCGAAGTLAEARQRVAEQLPDLVLLDLRLGEENGLQLIRPLRDKFPNLRILVLSHFNSIPNAETVLREGASGYVMKEQATDNLLRAIRTVLSGQTYPPKQQSIEGLPDPSMLPKSSQSSRSSPLSEW